MAWQFRVVAVRIARKARRSGSSTLGLPTTTSVSSEHIKTGLHRFRPRRRHPLQTGRRLIMERVQDQYRFWRHRFRPRGRHPLQKSLKRDKHKLWQRQLKQKATRRPHTVVIAQTAAQASTAVHHICRTFLCGDIPAALTRLRRHQHLTKWIDET